MSVSYSIFIVRFPFYWETKTALLLFLSLPQTQGSTWVYKTYLQPFFSENEAEIDAGISSAHTSILAFVQSRLAQLWDVLQKLSAGHQGVQQEQVNGEHPAGASQPASVDPLGVARGLWNYYGTSVTGLFQKRSTSVPTGREASSTPSTPPALRPGASSTPSANSISSIPTFPEPVPPSH